MSAMQRDIDKVIPSLRPSVRLSVHSLLWQTDIFTDSCFKHLQ